MMNVINRRTKLSLQYVLKLGSNQQNPTHNVVFNAKFKSSFERKPKQIPPLSIRVSCDLRNGKNRGTTVLAINFNQLILPLVFISTSDLYHVVIIHRLRIGHTRLTHSYLLSGTDQPECSACHCPLTVKHILIECPALISSRNKHFTASSMKDLFDNVAARHIINFIINPIFIALYDAVSTYFILASSLDLNIIFTLSL